MPFVPVPKDLARVKNEERAQEQPEQKPFIKAQLEVKSVPSDRPAKSKEKEAR